LRTEGRSSRLFDGEAYARHFESAIESAWQAGHFGGDAA
jgi:hypothetical protein